MLLRKDLVRVHERFSSREEAQLAMAGRFVDAGLAKPSYPEAIIARESVYATGIPVDPYPISISHCDSEHVIESSIGVSVLDEPLEFACMGGMEGGPLAVRVIFMLAIKDPNAQVPTLQKMMALIQNQELLASLVKAADAEEAFELLAPALED